MLGFQQTFEDRLAEIDSYLDFLDMVDHQLQSTQPRIGSGIITTQQQRILYSSVYLQLYNLVEATATKCIDAVSAASSKPARWLAADLSDQIRREWVRTTARTHVELSSEHRLATALRFCEMVSSAEPVSSWTIERGGGGNWDDIEIQSICERLGLELKIPSKEYSDAKRVIRNDKNSLGLVKDLRNKLAHGEISFSECGDGVTVAELRDLKRRTEGFLRAVVLAFDAYLNEHGYVVPGKRPVAGVGQ